MARPEEVVVHIDEARILHTFLTREKAIVDPHYRPRAASRDVGDRPVRC